ncbi:MAG: hypothetical protein B7Z75_11300 [Acidocella sp. 20-57-95]|nr:MAG: hypothetical protein B7Z75_11300 [Acidocella sp. 20-57-95]HQT64981.1 DUF535 family protein [Acidocella sp.]
MPLQRFLNTVPTVKTTLVHVSEPEKTRQRWGGIFRRVCRGFEYLPRLFVTAPAFSRILRLIFQPKMFWLLGHQPALPFKYLSKFYVSRSLSTDQRAVALHHHYMFFGDVWRDDFRKQLAFDRALIFEHYTPTAYFNIQLAIASAAVKEGELSLYFQMNHVDLYQVSFSFVPGSIAGLGAETVVFVSRIQGVKHNFSDIRDATKALFDIAPPTLLLAALQGIAKALGISDMLGIPAADLVGSSHENATELSSSYDAFFQAIGAIRQGAFYVCRLPLAEKPITLIKPGHRCRTQKKRRFKNAVIDIVANHMIDIAAAPRFTLSAESTVIQPDPHFALNF